MILKKHQKSITITDSQLEYYKANRETKTINRIADILGIDFNILYNNAQVLWRQENALKADPVFNVDEHANWIM